MDWLQIGVWFLFPTVVIVLKTHLSSNGFGGGGGGVCGGVWHLTLCHSLSPQKNALFHNKTHKEPVSLFF
jgi:hypothetical protein